MRSATKRKIRKSLLDNWGYLLLALVFLGWFAFGARNPLVLAIGSFLVVIYSLFFAVVPCGAENKRKRDGGPDYCGNNGRGLLGGCRFRRHKWENFKTIAQRQQAVAVIRHILSTFRGKAAAFSAVAGMGSFVVALMTFAFITLRQPAPPPLAR